MLHDVSRNIYINKSISLTGRHNNLNFLQNVGSKKLIKLKLNPKSFMKILKSLSVTDKTNRPKISVML